MFYRYPTKQVGAEFFQEGGLQSGKFRHFELPSEDLWRQNANVPTTT